MNKAPDTQPPNFFAWVQRFAGWIAAVLGFFSGIVGFVEAVRNDWGLFSTITLGTGFLLVWGSLFYVWLRKRTVGLELGVPHERPFYDTRKRHLALVGLIIWPLLGLGGWWYVEVYSANTDKIIVIVADFDGPDETYGVTETILSQLRRGTEPFHDTKIIALKEKITVHDGSALARKKGEARGASFVLWGWYRVPHDTALVNVYFEVLDNVSTIASRKSTWSERVSVAELESFQLQTRFSSEMEYLTLFMLGLLRYEAGSYDEAIERLTTTLEQLDLRERFLINPAGSYFYRGNAYAHKELYNQAIADYTRGIELSPDLAMAYNNRGSAYARKGDYDSAIVDYNWALVLEPDLAMAYRNRGFTYHHRGDYDRAIADFDFVVELNPNYAIVYNDRGRVYGLKGDYDRAIADYDQAIKLDPNYAFAFNNRGIAYRHKGNYDRAIADYDQAIKLNSDLFEVYLNRGSAYYYRGDYNQAIADYDRAIELNPDYAKAYNKRGIAYRHKGDYNQAIADYNRAIELNPDYADAYNKRGSAYYYRGNYDQAIADYDRAIELNPDYTDAYNNRGIAYNAIGDSLRAQEDFAQARERD